MNDQDAQRPDSAVIVQSLREPAAFAVLFDRYYNQIWRYACRRAGPAVADEVASETFLRAFAGRAGFDRSQSRAGPWLYGIATNLLRDHRRSETRRWRAYARAPAASGTHGGLEDAEQRLDAGALAPAIVAAIAELKPVDRDALLLLALAGLDYESIATATGVPVGTVRSRLNRARRQLQARLGAAEAKENAR